jgi:hypothetical protein
MERTVNRWLTVVLLFCFLAIIAFAAGRQNATAPTNVLVTNTTSQPVPIKQTATLNVNDLTHGKDGLQLFRNFTMSAGSQNGIGSVNAIPGERFVITDIDVTYGSVNSDNLTILQLYITDSHSGGLATIGIPVTTQVRVDGAAWSFGHWQGTLYLDSTQILSLDAYRSGTVAGTVGLTLSGYRVAYP